MPRRWAVVCEYCGKSAIVPAVKQPRYCSRDCFHAATIDSISQRIGEPFDSAVERRYVLLRMSYREISAELGVNVRTIMHSLERSGIEPRRGGDAVKTQWENNAERREATGQLFGQIARDYYANGGESPSKRPDVRLKISAAKTADNWMSGRTGAKHHNWKGGKVWWRGKEWDDVKHEIRARDGDACRQCGMSNDECVANFGGPLQVHHIVPYRLSHDNSPSNLVTLCNRCHTSADHAFLWLL